jgi:hypothetical protein
MLGMMRVGRDDKLCSARFGGPRERSGEVEALGARVNFEIDVFAGRGGRDGFKVERERVAMQQQTARRMT